MIIVLIHWRIKPTEDAENAFFAFWTKQATILDKSGLCGEFLSAPSPASKFPFRVDDFQLSNGEMSCRHFVNVGCWRDWQSFNDQVGKYMKDDAPMLPFEMDRRTRTILEPRHWRIGQWPFLSEGSCE
jgi:hypothetical protein